MSAFLLSFALIFFAELGDKSQLVALWFATRYRWWLVLLGVTVATLIVHLGSTAIGASAADVLPEAALLVVVGLSFFAFAAWGIRGDRLADDGVKSIAPSWLGAFGIITIAFFLSELGDKTQLATISLAGHEDDFAGVWLGSTAGMIAADALAIAAGVIAGKHLPQRKLALISAGLFVGFGVLALGRAATLMV